MSATLTQEIYIYRERDGNAMKQRFPATFKTPCPAVIRYACKPLGQEKRPFLSDPSMRFIFASFEFGPRW